MGRQLRQYLPLLAGTAEENRKEQELADIINELLGHHAIRNRALQLNGFTRGVGSIEGVGQFFVGKLRPDKPHYVDGTDKQWNVQLETRMAHKMIGGAPGCSGSSQVLSLTGVGSPVIHLTIVHCKQAGSITGLSAFCTDTFAGGLTLKVEKSTNDGVSFAAVTDCELAIAGQAGEVLLNKDLYPFVKGDLLRLKATRTSGNDDPGEMSAEIDVEYENY